MIYNINIDSFFEKKDEISLPFDVLVEECSLTVSYSIDLFLPCNYKINSLLSRLGKSATYTVDAFLYFEGQFYLADFLSYQKISKSYSISAFLFKPYSTDVLISKQRFFGDECLISKTSKNFRNARIQKKITKDSKGNYYVINVTEQGLEISYSDNKLHWKHEYIIYSADVEDASLIIDSTEKLCILYKQAGKLYYIEGKLGNWSNPVLIEGDDSKSYKNLTLCVDNHDRLVIGYVEDDTKIYCRKCASNCHLLSNWSSKILFRQAASGYHIKEVVIRTRPYSPDTGFEVSWTEYDPEFPPTWEDNLFYAEGNTWQYFGPGTPENYASGDNTTTTYATDDDGNDHFTYSDKDENVKYRKRKKDGTWTEEEIIGSGTNPCILVWDNSIFILYETKDGFILRAKIGDEWQDPIEFPFTKVELDTVLNYVWEYDPDFIRVKAFDIVFWDNGLRFAEILKLKIAKSIQLHQKTAYFPNEIALSNRFIRDSHNVLHVVHVDSDNHYLHHLWSNDEGETWQGEYLDISVCAHATIANVPSSPNDKIYIYYMDEDEKTLYRVVKDENGNWSSPYQVDFDFGIFVNVTADTNSDGNVFFAAAHRRPLVDCFPEDCLDCLNFFSEHAIWQCETWSGNTDPNEIGSDVVNVAMRIDENDRMHIFLHCGFWFILYYYEFIKEGTNQYTQTEETQFSDVTQPFNMAVGTESVHFVYVETSPENLYLKYRKKVYSPSKQWLDPITIYSTGKPDQSIYAPAINVINNNHIQVLWWDAYINKIILVEYKDGQWQEAKELFDYSSDHAPAICPLQGSNLYFTYQGNSLDLFKYTEEEKFITGRYFYIDTIIKLIGNVIYDLDVFLRFLINYKTDVILLNQIVASYNSDSLISKAFDFNYNIDTFFQINKRYSCDVLLQGKKTTSFEIDLINFSSSSRSF